MLTDLSIYFIIYAITFVAILAHHGRMPTDLSIGVILAYLIIYVIIYAITYVASARTFKSLGFYLHSGFSSIIATSALLLAKTAAVQYEMNSGRGIFLPHNK